jgi:hypothetical protein
MTGYPQAARRMHSGPLSWRRKASGVAVSLLLAVGVLAGGSLAAPNHRARHSGKIVLSVGVLKVSRVPLRAGDAITVRWSLRNGLRRRLPRATVRYYLSPARGGKPGPGAIRLVGGSPVSPLPMGRSARGTTRLLIPGGSPGKPKPKRKRRHSHGKRPKGRKASGSLARAAQSGGLYVVGCEGSTCASSSQPVNVACGLAVCAPTPTLQGRTLQGQVLYEKRSCYRGPTSLAALPDARLVLTAADGTTFNTALSPTGTYSVTVSGPLPLSAKVVLDDARVAVGSVAGGGAYEVALGPAATANLQAPDGVDVISQFIARGDGPAGASNIFAVLDDGAIAAGAASPVPIPKVTARWNYAADLTSWLADQGNSEYDDSSSPRYDAGSKTIMVGGGSNGEARDEWEAFPLLHEYAHHVLATVADPGPTGGTHGFRSTHPTNPTLPWSEGFANAFYAIVTGNPRPTLGCQPATDQTSPGVSLDYSATPATPLPDDPRLAQYNETAIAATLWGLANHFGVGDARGAGLRAILYALHGYRREGHAVQSVRDFRDALIVAGLENGNRLEHSTIDKIFAAQRIAWGVYVTVDEEDSRIAGSKAGEEVGLSLGAAPGKYGGCPTYKYFGSLEEEEQYWAPNASRPFGWSGNYGGRAVMPGDLSYTWQSDCMAANYWNSTVGLQSAGAEFLLRFPYLQDQSHQGLYTLDATWECRDESVPSGHLPPPEGKCTPDRKFRVRVDNGVWGGRFDAQVGAPKGVIRAAVFEGAQDWTRPEALPAGTISAVVTLTNNVTTPVVQFNGAGAQCAIIQTVEVDCSD